jgi:hypothetical protein
MMEPWVICDLDGTLADCGYRAGLIPDWDAFHKMSPMDKPYPAITKLLELLNSRHPVLILTGRPEEHRGITLAWLKTQGVSFDELSMRPTLNYESDVDCKWAQAVAFFGSEEQVLAQTFIVIDDRDKVVEMWRNKGLTCLQPRLGDY